MISRWKACAAGAVLALIAAPSWAQSSAPTDGAVDKRAMASLMRMADFLSKAPHFTVTADIGYDVEQSWGQKLEFGATRKITVRRPDRLAVDIVDRNGTRRGFRFDGRQIAFFGQDEGVYATAQKAGSLDDAIGYFTGALQMPLPLAEVLTNNLPQDLRDRVQAAYFVGEETIGATRCEHVALRSDLVDAQVWIAKTDTPLPQRIVMTYKLANGQPQFWANFRDWDLSATPADSVFVFEPAKDARKITFVAGAEPDSGSQP